MLASSNSYWNCPGTTNEFYAGGMKWRGGAATNGFCFRRHDLSTSLTGSISSLLIGKYLMGVGELSPQDTIANESIVVRGGGAGNFSLSTSRVAPTTTSITSPGNLVIGGWNFENAQFFDSFLPYYLNISYPANATSLNGVNVSCYSTAYGLTVRFIWYVGIPAGIPELCKR